MNVARLLHNEIATINRTLADHNVDAGTRPAWTIVAASSFVAYGVRLGRAERVSSVERLLPELAEIISAGRGVATPVRLRRLPLALEVPHPRPQALPHVLPDLQAHTLHVGRSYGFDGAHDETLSFDETPHALVAGMTGAGKSVLLAQMLLTLTRHTSPADLALVLVDLKNEDLVPFQRLPHVLRFAGSPADAAAAVDYVHSVKEDRRRTRQRPFRLVLAIDELAELATLPDALTQLGSILSVGRSMSVNVLAATQHPLAKVVGGIAKANFPVRLVGMVSDANAASVATGRPSTGAEMLPGRGSFLRVQSADVVRFQTHHVTPQEVRMEVRATCQQWHGMPTIADLVSTPAAASSSSTHNTPTVTPALAAVFAEYADGESLRRGGMAAALRVLHGQHAPTGGRAYQDAADVVLDRLRTWQASSANASAKTSNATLPRDKAPQMRMQEDTDVKVLM